MNTSSILHPLRLSWVLLGLCGALAAPVQAQVFPDRAIKIIVPASPGGATDVLARLYAKAIGDSWKQSTVVENRPGASGIIGIDAAAKSPPDGYTALLGYTFMVQAPALYPKLPYDVSRDFIPIVQMARSPNLFVVPASSPANTLAEFVQLVKKAPGKHSFGSNGIATTAHMQGTLLNKRTGMDLVHTPFKGSAPQLNAVLGDQVSSAIIDIGSARGHLKAGQIKVLAVTGEQRLQLLPNVPTFHELGYEGFEAVGWFGLFLPAATPKEVVAKYVEESSRVMRLPEVAGKVEDLGLVLVNVGPEEFARRMKSDAELWARIIRDGNIKLDQ
jgi:tripartite-type tricarboxylate transporter receptor subunit TctC